MAEEFIVEKNGSCKKVYIPKEYCTIYLIGQVDSHIEMSKVGNDLCIENLSKEMKCQRTNLFGEELKTNNRKKWKRKNGRK